jgi:uncharacterized protein with PQ loop repeat
MIDVLGVAGGLILSYSNLPQLILFFKQKHAIGISKSSTWIGTFGLILRFIYLIHVSNTNFIVLWPYLFAFICCAITLYYCYFPKLPLVDGTIGEKQDGS